MRKHGLIAAVVLRISQCCLLAALLLLAQHALCLQLGLQQPAPADSKAALTVQQHQKQQQQHHHHQIQQHQPQGLLKPPEQQPAKPNHRLVSKLKDARHRRRHHRQHRQHRHHHHSLHLSDKSAATLLEPQAGASQTLTALESIVEEVARAGQLQPPPPLQPPPVSPATSAAEFLLDGPSSPISHMQPAASQPQPAQQHKALVQAVAAQAAAPSSRPAGHNSRGFFLTTMLSKIMNVLNVTEFALEMRDGISSRASCMACNAVVGLFLSPLYSKDVFSAAIRTVCTSFKIQSARVCAGLVESFQDDFEYIRKNTKLTRDEVCAVVFGVDCARRQTYNLFWTVPIPELPSKPVELATGHSVQALAEQGLDEAPDLFEYRKSNVAAPAKLQPDKQSSMASTVRPAVDKSEQLAQAGLSPTELQAKSGKLLKRPQYIFDDEHSLDRRNKVSSFVHITDIHIDPYYEPGSLNDCNEPLCCRATSGPVPQADKRRQAGKWGDYGNCDTPVRTLQSALNRIREQHSNAEYWLWTGDISPHDIWNISKSEAASHVRLVTKMVREYSSGLPVFPVIGNHEAHPVNSFSPPEIKGKFSMSWLYDLLADEWSEWLPKDAIKTLRVGGYYKLLVRKGFRIIALNTNYCARLNPWSFYDPVDPANQLKWLVEELLEAELNQDKVHIIGHVPPDNRECTQAWLFNFINIVDRFKDTIVAQFYGHTHRDEWRLIYSLKQNDQPIGIQYIGPSLTPFTENNPAYRIYYQDKSGHLIDSETYYFNLTEANESPESEPNWRFSYRTREHLNMTQGMTANRWHQYLQMLHEDDELFDSFFRNYYRFSDVKMGQVCKTKCKYQTLSDLRVSHPYKTKPKPFLANRKTSNHHRDRDHHHHSHRERHHTCHDRHCRLSANGNFL